jgi:flagellar motor protein MotB
MLSTRSWLILILFLAAVNTAFPQNDRSFKSLLQEADQYYAEEQYNLAIQFYRELSDQNVQDTRVAYNLAECYRMTFNYSDAEAYYLKVYFLAPEEHPLALYYYAQMLKFNGNFDESITYFDQFIDLHQKTKDYPEYVEQAIVDKAGSEIAKAELASDKNVTKFESLNLNTVFNDYAPAVRDSMSVVITSGRILSNRESIDERFGEAFTDNYYFEKANGVWQDKTKSVFSITNTRYNDGSGCFNSKGDKYYFTVCGLDGPHCKIFLSVLKNGKWTEPVPLNTNVNYKSTESKHPAVSQGGDTLIFASNRNGGHGRFDIWMCIDAGDEMWGPAMNLGPSVNTKLNEVSPSLTAYKNVLFFASDGHPGHGGLDIFMAKRLSTADTVLFNLDLPFNSNRDDCFMSFSERQLYWSSNRPKGVGGFDIYSVRIPSVLAFISRISLKKRDARRSIHLTSKTESKQQLSLAASRVEEKIDFDNLSYEKKQIVQRMIENRIQKKEDKHDYYVGLTNLEYEQLSAIANDRYEDYLEKKNENNYLSIISPDNKTPQDLMVTGILADSLTGSPLPSRKVLLTDDVGVIQKITVSNEQGKFRFTDVASNQVLFIKMDKFADVKNVVPLVRDLKISGSEVQPATHFENVYFDFDHYRVRPEAKQVLDGLADQLIRNPEVQVEIFAYADDRGTSEYNLRLSQKRGQAVVDYLSQKGVDQTGLAIIAKGKQATIQNSGTALQRQYDRRVELYVNGKALVTETAHTYIVKKKTDWSALSQMTGIPKEELRSLNGATEDQLKAFQPVRIPEEAKGISEENFFITR